MVPSSDVRSSETSAQNVQGKNFQKFTCSNFHGFVFHGPYFHVLVVGCENLDLAKISRYTAMGEGEDKQQQGKRGGRDMLKSVYN